MEENIHDDKLDDYVRRSFEGHEENPPADMWSRVEGDLLPSVEVSTVRALSLRYGWQALAAVVILVLFSTLVCEHLYYEKKLRDMAEKSQADQEILERSHRKDEATGQAIHANPNSHSATELPVESKTITFPPNARQSANLERTATVIPSPKTAKEHAPVQHLVDFERNQGSSTIPKSEPYILQKPQKSSDKTDKSYASVGAVSNEKPSLPPSVETTVAGQNTPNLLPLTVIPIARILLEQSPSNSPTFAKVSIKPVRKPSGWYLGLQTSLLAIIEKPRAPISRPGRPAFSSKKENAGISTIWWLKSGKKLDSRFSLESGIGYQITSRTATHSPKFRFGDGAHLGGPFANRRTFNYDLSTYGGTAEVSLRMEQTLGSPAPDDEPLSLEITTTEYNKLLRIPLLAGYQLGAGRLQGQVKAGLMGNYVLKNELDISARVSQNARFQAVGGRDGYTVQLNQKKFFLGYWLSVGAEFKLNQHLSLVAESAMLGDFLRKDQHNRRLPERFMLGFNLGANYYF